MPGKTDFQPPAQVAHQFEHSFPFGKHDHLHPFVLAAFFEHFLQLRQLRTVAHFRVENVGGVADHAHHGQMDHEPVLLLFGERTALGDGGQAGHDVGVVIIDLLLLWGELHEMLAVGAVGQFGFHVAFAAAQHVGRDALVQPARSR